MTTNPIIADVESFLNDDIVAPLKNLWNDIKTKGVADLENLATTALHDLGIAEQNAATAVTNAKAGVASVINPQINAAIGAAATAAEAAFPGLGPIINGAEPQVLIVADTAADTFTINLMTRLASTLTSQGKSLVAVQLSNIAGAI